MRVERWVILALTLCGCTFAARRIEICVKNGNVSILISERSLKIEDSPWSCAVRPENALSRYLN